MILFLFFEFFKKIEFQKSIKLKTAKVGWIQNDIFLPIILIYYTFFPILYAELAAIWSFNNVYLQNKSKLSLVPGPLVPVHA